VTPRRLGTTIEAPRTSDGCWYLDAEHEWLVEGDPEVLDGIKADLGSPARRLGSRMIQLWFGNSVGRYRAGALGVLQVHSSKWTDENYTAMLGEISVRAAALPFHAGAASALPYGRTEVDAPDVLYHAFVWLRHAIVDQRDSPLVGALRAIVADPHRRLAMEARVVATEDAAVLAAGALEDIVAGVHPFRRVRSGRGLMGGDWMPATVGEFVTRPTADTTENRFVKAFLDSCGFVLAAIRQRVRADDSPFSRRVRHDCDVIEGELGPVVNHSLWSEVGRLRHFPGGSIVLQRRSAYREVMKHHVLLRMTSKALPLSAAEVTELLEVRNIAKLYELWTAFAVIDAISTSKGAAVWVQGTQFDEFGAKVGAGLMARWADGTELAYDKPFTRNDGFHGHSWSVALRPDVSLWVPQGPSEGLHLFDAKFKIDRSQSGAEPGGCADVHATDIHKMHAYRDAIPEARSAWVMYPGTAFSGLLPDGSRVHSASELPEGVGGVGAVPLVPGSEPTDLRALLGVLLGISRATARISAS